MDEKTRVRTLRGLWNGFRGAVGFLTILPSGKVDFAPAEMIGFFPVVGLILGGVAAGVDSVACRLWPLPLASMLTVLTLVVLSGALHVDGLADAGDGLFSHRSKERALAIMKDSRIGVMGLMSVVAILALKWGAVLALGEHRFLTLLVVPGYARLGMLAGMRWLPYGRPEGGTGAPFCVPASFLKTFWSAGLLVVLSIFLGWKGLALNMAFAAGCAGLLMFYSRTIGCITGDTLGAMNEVLEALLLVVAAVQIF